MLGNERVSCRARRKAVLVVLSASTVRPAIVIATEPRKGDAVVVAVVGNGKGDEEGAGDKEGSAVGFCVGAVEVGERVGRAVDISVGNVVGAGTVGLNEGDGVSAIVGEAVCVGNAVGLVDGGEVGVSERMGCCVGVVVG